MPACLSAKHPRSYLHPEVLKLIISLFTLIISCNNEPQNPDRFKSGTFEIPEGKGYEKTIIIRQDSIQIEKYEDRIDTLSISWKNNFNYTLKGNTLQLNSHLSTNAKNKFSDQEIVVVLNLPEGCVVKFSNNTRRYLNHNIASNYVNHYLNVVEDGIECNDCEDDEFDVDVDIPNIKKPVPLFILMRGLGVMSDKDIIQSCLFKQIDMHTTDKIIDLFIPSIHV